MPEGASLGLWIIIGVVILAILITYFGGGKSADEDEKDIEHLDHEARGDSPEH